MSIDISDLKAFKKEIKKMAVERLSELADDGVRYAKENGDYENRTHNLRNAVGAAVIVDGKIKHIYIPSKGGYEEAREKTRELIQSSSLKNGIVIADGMEYASFVESKGFDVIGGGALHIEAEGKKLNDK